MQRRYVYVFQKNKTNKQTNKQTTTKKRVQQIKKRNNNINKSNHPLNEIFFSKFSLGTNTTVILPLSRRLRASVSVRAAEPPASDHIKCQERWSLARGLNCDLNEKRKIWYQDMCSLKEGSCLLEVVIGSFLLFVNEPRHREGQALNHFEMPVPEVL